MTKTLDKAKPFGEICGVMEGTPTARFEQDGQLFDVDGNLVGQEPTAAKRRPRKTKDEPLPQDAPEQDETD